jgi:hypothetical protein
VITWTPVEEYVQPDLSIPEVKQVPTLFWAKGVGPVLGHLKDGDLWSEDFEESYETAARALQPYQATNSETGMISSRKRNKFPRKRCDLTMTTHTLLSTPTRLHRRDRQDTD